jgi:hypothetical protein
MDQVQVRRSRRAAERRFQSGAGAVGLEESGWVMSGGPRPGEMLARKRESTTGNRPALPIP